MWRDLLREKLESDQPALGVWIGSVEWVELAAHIGFDWFMIDQMFTGLDWSKTEELVRAGEAYGITPVVRVQTHPWAGYDPRIAVDVSRALGIGTRYVLVSNSGKREIEDAAKVSHDWHRRVLTVHPFNSDGEWDASIDEIARENHIIPQPEALTAFDELWETLEIPEVRILFFAMTDASKELKGHSNKPDWYLPALWDHVDQAVARGGELGKHIGANTSYAYDMGEMQKRVLRLHEHGVKMILMQGATFLWQVAIGEFLRDTKKAMGR